MQTRNSYPSDVSDEEWAFVAPYLTLMKEDAPQRDYALRDVFNALRDVFNALRWLVRTGSPWRYLPNDLPPWYTVYPQAMRWHEAGRFADLVTDLRHLLRKAAGRHEEPTAAIIDGRTLQSTPESGSRAGYDGYKRKKGSKIHLAVDTLGYLLAATVTPANEQERSQVGALSEAIQKATGQSVERLYADQGYTGDQPREAAEKPGIALEIVSLPEAKKGFVLLPKRWVVERSFAWTARFRRLARDYERLDETVKALHFIAYSILMLAQVDKLLNSS